MLAPLVDTHAHLCDPALWGSLDHWIEEAGAVGVVGILCVGYDLLTCERSLEAARRHPVVAASVGIHPNNLKYATGEDFERLNMLARSGGVVAIGETGMDFHWNSSPPDTQREAFEWHLHLAKDLSLALTIHTRKAETAVLDVLDGFPGIRAALHCFGGTKDEARRALDLGFYLGLDGPVTFPKATEVHALASFIPLDRLLVETDAPYLSPHPFRRELNHPARVEQVARRIAELRNIDYFELCECLTGNARELFPAAAEWRVAPQSDAADRTEAG